MNEKSLYSDDTYTSGILTLEMVQKAAELISDPEAYYRKERKIKFYNQLFEEIEAEKNK